MQDFDLTKEVFEYLTQMSESERECKTSGYMASKEHATELVEQIRSCLDKSAKQKFDLLEWENIQMQLEVEDYMFLKGATWCFEILTNKKAKK